MTKADTTFTLTPNANPLVVGQSLDVTVAIRPKGTAGGLAGSSPPSGAVTFKVDGIDYSGNPVSLNGSGNATITVGVLTLGQHSIDVTYAGDTNYNGVASTTSTRLYVTVAKGTVTMNLTPASQSAELGDPVTFTATVNPNSPSTLTPTGTVKFYLNTVSGTPLATVTLTARTPASRRSPRRACRPASPRSSPCTPATGRTPPRRR